MTFPIFLRWLLRRFTAFLRILRYLVPTARLRFLLSLFTRRFQHRPRTSATETGPKSVIGSSAIDESDLVNVCCSRLPSISSVGHISLDFITHAEGDGMPVSVHGAGPPENPQPAGATDGISSTFRVSISPNNDALSPSGPIQQTVIGEDTSQTRRVTGAAEGESLPLTQMTPMDLPRSTQRDSQEYKKSSEYELLPYETRSLLFAKESNISSIAMQWEQFTHPHGFMYFRHCGKRTWTFMDMRTPTNRRMIEKCVDLLEQRLSSPGFPNTDFPGGYELVVDVTDVDEKKGVFSGAYYCIHHASRSVFWLDRKLLTSKGELGDMRGSLSPSHIARKIEELYWRHLYLFPHVGPDNCSKSVWDKLLDDVDFNLQDCIASSRSTCLYSQIQLERMRHIASRACDQSKENTQLSSVSISMLARAQMLMVRQRFHHAHGQPFVRLQSTRSMFAGGKSAPSGFVLALVALALLGEPYIVLRDLNNVMVDGMVSFAGWKRFTQQLHDQWSLFIILATVILAVNISFLAIPDIVPNSSGTGDGVVPLEVSYASILLTILSMTSALTLSRYTTPEIGAFSEFSMVPYHDLIWLRPATLAVLSSIPFATLAWAILHFVAAILAVDFTPIPYVVYLLYIFILSSISVSTSLPLEPARDDRSSPAGEDPPVETNDPRRVVESV
ncbi:hypothetical protein PENSPDRAFT_80309 [Peniophora sp. CONT]|nr:hypothetical protein PENSPDRAFT_80309 [Peniophora sp. CONT]